METFVMLNNANCVVSLLKVATETEVKHIIRLEWSGVVREEQFKTALTTALDTAKIYKADLWLSDIKGLVSMPAALQTWSMTEWMPSICKVGLYRRQAIIQATDVSGKIIVHALKNKIRGQEVPVEMGEFSNQVESIKWLVS